MLFIKYTILACCAAIIRLSLSNDDFLNTPYIIKTIAILSIVIIGVVMIIRDIRKAKQIQQNQ